MDTTKIITKITHYLGPLTPEILAIIVGIISTVIGTLTYDFIKSKKNKIKVKLIKESSDSDVEGFIELYNKLIDDKIRVETTEIISWIDEDRVLRKINSHYYFHYLFVGKLKDKVVSFLKLMYSKNSCFMFIAYLGVDSTVDQARQNAGSLLIGKLTQLTKKELINCKAIICELEAPISGGDEKLNLERKARIRHFKEMAKRHNYKFYEIQFDYLQPQMEIPDNYIFSEEQLILLYAPVNDIQPLSQFISKDKLLDILQFLYLEIYRPTFRHDPIKDYAYQNYLNNLLMLYKVNLPNDIKLK